MSKISYDLPVEQICRSAALRKGNDDHLLVFFSSRVAFSRGRFDGWDFAQRLPHTQLFMREGIDMHFYLRGVPGLTDTMEETADFLRYMIKKLAPSRVSLVGLSLGAYAAVTVGHMVGVDDIHALSLVSFLDKNIGHEPDKSILWPEAFDDVKPLFDSGEVPGKYVDLRNVIADNVGKVGVLNVHFGGRETADPIHAQHISDFSHVRLFYYERMRHTNVAPVVMGRGILESCLNATPRQMLAAESYKFDREPASRLVRAQRFHA